MQETGIFGEIIRNDIEEIETYTTEEIDQKMQEVQDQSLLDTMILLTVLN